MQAITNAESTLGSEQHATNTPRHPKVCIEQTSVEKRARHHQVWEQSTTWTNDPAARKSIGWHYSKHMGHQCSSSPKNEWRNRGSRRAGRYFTEDQPVYHSMVQHRVCQSLKKSPMTHSLPVTLSQVPYCHLDMSLLFRANLPLLVVLD